MSLRCKGAEILQPPRRGAAPSASPRVLPARGPLAAGAAPEKALVEQPENKVDLVTRGSTLSRIATAIKAANPGANVYGVALGKTDRRSFWGHLDNNHVAKAWDDRWQHGEQAYKDHKAKGK
jgi:hypothetical protein